MKTEIEIPTTCPSCDSVLEQVNSQLFCRSKDCEVQSTKKVEAFVKKMRIKGLGPARISMMGFLSPLDIYETNLNYFVENLGEKVGEKIFDEVQNSRTTTFATFLSALCIPLIGDTASKKIASTGVNSIKDIVDIELIDGLGPTAEDNLYKYIVDSRDLFDLENYFTFMKLDFMPAAVKPQGNVCITGKLNDFSNRAKAKEFLEHRGYTVTGTVSAKTHYLVCEDGSNSSKSKKAEFLEIPIVTIASLLN